MTKFVSVLLITTSILNAGYDMAFAKASKEIKIGKPKSVKVTYVMHDMLKKDFEDSMLKALHNKGIQIDNKATVDIEIVPVRFASMKKMGVKYWDALTPSPLSKWEPPQDANQTILASKPNENLSGSAKKTFLNGVSQAGSQGTYSTLAQGVGNMVTVGLINVGLGMIGNGIDNLWTSSDKHIMISDVVINGERTRIFAMLKDGSVISVDEAIEVLSKLTADKIVAMLGGNK
ncbi:MAG: hypothetical protein PHW18_09630 [Sulfuricurvum sp.]|uniref:hypothetical protein n=1 Tax=Sulfuricurvum sp. TaxID=2025608 RepID=UPI002607CB59|nr:hypothetical protein [Sulfuricurvum sp.]MDD2829819.1 hypothetical protein [Sulfuricurvum sp.]MDD4950272.1 hypothetical protein [Sulfuricurvum sp.]